MDKGKICPICEESLNSEIAYELHQLVHVEKDKLAILEEILNETRTLRREMNYLVSDEGPLVDVLKRWR